MNAAARVLFVNHAAALSGAEQGLLDIVGHLDRARYAPVCVIPAPGKLADRLRAAGADVWTLPLLRFRKTLCPLALGRYLWSLAAVAVRLARLIRRQNIRLVHANSNTAQLYGGLAARLTGVPCIWHSRDLVDLGLAGRLAASLATRIVAISDAVARQLRTIPSAAPKVTRIYNGIDLDRLRPQPARNALRKAFGAGPATCLIGTLGQLVPWKHHALFLEASARIAGALPAARFLIVGDDRFGDHPEYRGELEAQARRLGIEVKVAFTGYREDVADVLDALDIVVHTAEREPFGRAVAEAMAVGKPVVAVNACGPAELIRSGRDGLLVAPAAEDVARAVLSLAAAPATAARLGRAARERIARDFSVAAAMREIEALYASLVPETASGAS